MEWHRSSERFVHFCWLNPHAKAPVCKLVDIFLVLVPFQGNDQNVLNSDAKASVFNLVDIFLVLKVPFQENNQHVFSL